MKKLTLATVFALIPGLALAHTGVGNTHGFTAGFIHPIGGLDHILAMVAIGLLTAALGGRALWLVPTSFVSMMLAGGALGMASIDVPAVELGITMSIVVVGAIVAFGQRLPTGIAMAVAGAFAIFHGHAHGVEMPVGSSAAGYALGFIVATSILHVLGIGLGLGANLIGRAYSHAILRSIGSLVAALGLGILAGVI